MVGPLSLDFTLPVAGRSPPERDLYLAGDPFGYNRVDGGTGGFRSHDLMLFRHTLSQLSYRTAFCCLYLLQMSHSLPSSKAGGLEPPSPGWGPSVLPSCHQIPD